MSRERDADCIDLNRTDFDVQYKQRIFVVESRLELCFWESSFHAWLGVTKSKILEQFQWNIFFKLTSTISFSVCTYMSAWFEEFLHAKLIHRKSLHQASAQNCSNAEVCCWRFSFCPESIIKARCSIHSMSPSVLEGFSRVGNIRHIFKSLHSTRKTFRLRERFSFTRKSAISSESVLRLGRICWWINHLRN